MTPWLKNIGGMQMSEYRTRSPREDSELGTRDWLRSPTGRVSWAATARVKGALREAFAAVCFFGYRSGMVRLVRGGQVWHADLELLLLVMPVGRLARTTGPVMLGTFGALAFVGVLSGISPAFGIIPYSVLVVFLLIWLLPGFTALPFLCRGICAGLTPR